MPYEIAANPTYAQMGIEVVHPQSNRGEWIRSRYISA